MSDLVAEVDAIRTALMRADIEYAVCGGIAMAIHGFTRATEDIDLFNRPEDYEALKSVVGALGYSFEAQPMRFLGGEMQIRRVSKIESGDTLTLDLLLVTPATEDVWQSRSNDRVA